MSHLASAKPDRGFHLVAFLQPLARMLHAVVVIVVVSTRPKLYFLDRDRYRLLLRLVLILSEVDDAANRRFGVRGDLNQIQPFLPGPAHGIAHIHHAELLPVVTNHAHLRHANSFINANRRHTPVIRTLTATAKACS